MGFEVNRNKEVNANFTKPALQQNKVKNQPQNIDFQLDNKFKDEKGFDLLTESTASMLGATFNLTPKKLSPVNHPEIKALSEKLSEYVGVPHISAEKAAELNKTADLEFAAKTIPNFTINDEVKFDEAATAERMEMFFNNSPFMKGLDSELN